MTQARLDFTFRTALTKTAPTSSNRALIGVHTELSDGRYVIQEVLGSGGEGVVYRAHDHLRGEQVAIKVLHVDDGIALPQLKREFRFLRDLVHPNLLQLYELVVQREISFFTMAYVAGDDFLKSAQSESDLVALTIQLADVLTFLHGTGRVHRDVKPSNILVRSSGELILLDFGIGLDLNANKPERQALRGTPRYIAPELLALRGATASSDAYSMGILLYEALTGQHPQASGRTQLDQRAGFDPREKKAGVPPHWAELIIGLTEPDPARRFQIGQCLDLLSGKRTRSRPISTINSFFPTSFTGREAELARLEAAKEWVSDGLSPFVVRIEAQSGMGKTSLLNHFLKNQRNTLVLRGRCSEHELVAHKAIDGVVSDLVEFVKSCPEEQQLEIVPEVDAAILLQLFAEFCGLPVCADLPRTEIDQGDFRALRKRAYMALSGVLARLAQLHELVVAIDDVQWGDLDSGKLINEVFGGAERPNCLLVLCYRSEEKSTSECLAELFERKSLLSDDVPGTIIELGPLGDADCRLLVESILGTERPLLVDQIVREASGSPLLLTEMAAHVETQGVLKTTGQFTEVMNSIVSSRLDTLSESARDAFYMLCFFGSVTEVSLLSDFTGLPSAPLVRKLEQTRLARSRHGGMWIEPLHDAIRESVVHAHADLAHAYHRRIAEALVQRNGDPAEIARHFEACDDKRTSTWAETAADLAARSFALGAAVSLYRLAQKTAEHDPERDRHLRHRLAETLADSGRGAEAAPLFAQLATEVAVDQAIEFQRRAAEQWLVTGEAKKGTEVLVQVQSDVGLRWPKSTAGAVVALLYHRSRLALLSDATLDAAIREKSDPRLELQLAACRAAWPISMISTIHGASNSSLYLRLALKAGKRSAMSIGCAMEAIYHAISGPKNREKVERWMSRAERVAPNTDDVYGRAFLTFSVGQNKYFLGDLRGCIAHFDEAESLFLKHGRGVAWELNSGRIFWSDALFYTGNHRELDRHHAAWITDAEERGDHYSLSALKISAAIRTVFQSGDVTAARFEVTQGEQLWDSPYVGYHHISQSVVESYLDIYSGNPLAALGRVPSMRKMMKQSYLDQVHVAQVQIGIVEAIACIEAAADLDAGARRPLLQRARELSQMMRAAGALWSTALGCQFQALSDLIEAPDKAGMELLAYAGQLFQEAGMILYAAGVQARTGELMGGAEGKVLLDQAHAIFEARDVADWVAVLSCHTPRVLGR